MIRGHDDTRRRTTRALTVPSTYGALTGQIDFWNGDESFDIDTLDPRDDTLNDGIAADNVVQMLSICMVAALTTLSRMNQLQRRSGMPFLFGSTEYVDTRSMTINGRTLRVKLRFNMNVEVPSPLLVFHAEKILDGVTGSILRVLDPEGLDEAADLIETTLTCPGCGGMH